MAVDQIEIRLSGGAQNPKVLPPPVVRALTGLEIDTADTGRSGFMLSFLPELDEAGDDYLLMSQVGLAPFDRLVVEVLIDNTATILIDGVITHRTLTLGADESSITLMGEDVSVLMDLEEKVIQHFEKATDAVVNSILKAYSSNGVTAKVTAPSAVAPIQAIQRGTDRAYLLQMADRYGFAFYLEPGKSVGKSTAYWGPFPTATGSAQVEMYVGPGAACNIESITFEQDALGAVTVVGKADTDEAVSVLKSTLGGLAKTAASTQKRLTQRQLDRVGGLTLAQAKAQAQGEANRASLDAATARGRLVVNDYGALLVPRRKVGVDGSGKTFDGDWYVRSVVTRLEGRSLVQEFELSREGVGRK